MSTAWIVAYVALGLLVVLSALLVLGTLRRLAPLFEQTQARLADLTPDLRPSGRGAGEPVPAFEAVRREGSAFTQRELLGTTSLVLLIGADCRACERLVDDLEHGRVADLGVRLVVATESAEQARQFDPRVEVVVQRHHEVANAFRSNVTPHAFVVDASGVIRGSGTPNDWERLRQLVVEATRGGGADSQLAAAVGSGESS